MLDNEPECRRDEGGVKRKPEEIMFAYSALFGTDTEHAGEFEIWLFVNLSKTKV